MAMASRSLRDTSHSIAGKVSSLTPGPGSYQQSKFVDRSPNFAGFASSTERMPFGGKLASTPGPGSYVQSRRIERRKVSSSAFRTSASRLCPSAPGSTVFAESTVVEVPGPGEYHNSTKIMKRRPKPKTSRLLVQSRFNPPAIPVSDQSHGYDEGEDGRLIPLLRRQRQRPTSNNDENAKHVVIGGFSKSRTRRHVFKVNEAGPGPGEYSPRNSYHTPIPTFDGTTGRCSQNSSRLAVPEKSFCLAGGEEEEEDFDDERGVGGPEFLGSSECKPESTSVLQCFGSTSERSSGWARPTTELLFTEPTSFKTPGPGSYACETTGFQTKVQKRLTDDPIPFNSSAARPSLKTTSSCLVGPGEYELEAESIATVLRKSKAGRFGSSARFGDSAREHADRIPASSDQRFPGPGQYDVQRDPQTDTAIKAARGVVQRAASIFRSKVARPGAAILPRIPMTTPGVGDYTIPTSLVSRKSRSAKTFATRARRFEESRLPDGAKINDAPGPGTYKPVDVRSRTSRGTPLLTEVRFREYIAPQTPADVGPGAYVGPGSCLTKSHNISYTTEKCI